MPTAKLEEQIEALRRRLHENLGSRYDPARIQALAPISEELDRLVVEYTRQELEQKKSQ
ncbi:MAG: hypothetical protein ACM3XM_19455 [Mycobacterium leprae]